MSIITHSQKQLSKEDIQKKLGKLAAYVERKTDQNRENQKPIFLKTDRRSVFGLLKTDRFLFLSRFPAGLYTTLNWEALSRKTIQSSQLL
jgi:hypothetical protein